MDLSFMQNDLVLALCWTLIHSLWQGLLLAMVTGAVMIGTRKSNAGKRYRVLTALFFMFMLVTVITFIRELNLISNHTAGVAVSKTVIHDQTLSDTINPADSAVIVNDGSFLERFKEYFNTHASLIVMIWFIIFIARLIKLTADLVYVQRLKNYKTFAAPGEWKDKVDELVLKLGICKKIQLLESAIIKVPVVMGVLKPVILLPVGLLSHLPADEIEAILLHELAHIQRKDYFMNLLQSFAETVFFFNPALMWLSSMIREERENCCDDIAIAVTNNKTNFINALIAFQEYNFSTTKHALSFPGRKNQLLNRVKRIINERNKTLNTMEKSLLTFSMGVLILFSFAAAKKITPTENKPMEIKETAASAKSQLQATLSVTQVKKTEASDNENVTEYNGSGELIAVLSAISMDTVPSAKKSTDDKKDAEIHDNDAVLHDKDAVLHEKILKLAADTVIKDNPFTNFSTNFSTDGNQSTMIYVAKTKDGKNYRLKKVNDQVTEFSINDEAIPASQFEAHKAEIALIENTYREKQLHNKLRKLARDDEHRKSIEREKLMIDKKRASMDERTAIEREKRMEDKIKRDAYKRVSDEEKVLLLQKHKEALKHIEKDKLTHLDKIKMEKDTLIWIKEKENGKMKWKLDMRMDSAKRIAMSQKRDEALMKRKMDIARDREIRDMEIRRDSVKRVTMSRDDLMKRKEAAMRDRELRDSIRFEESISVIKSIAADLEKEGIKIDMQKSWFALDKEQFLVDGKKMSTELHDKFLAKYVKANNGWGYYYGPIQTRGKGIFMGYKDITK